MVMIYLTNHPSYQSYMAGVEYRKRYPDHSDREALGWAEVVRDGKRRVEDLGAFIDGLEASKGEN
jgi:hypothetical protein